MQCRWLWSHCKLREGFVQQSSAGLRQRSEAIPTAVETVVPVLKRILAESVEISSTGMIAQRAIDRVKQIFYDGLRHLPWCKFWIIMGMRLLAQHQGGSERELQQLYDVMMEREMRIRIEIES